ncbi:MAG: hypothetical protein R3C56_22310 [Pirellulaceae bacterium]
MKSRPALQTVQIGSETVGDGDNDGDNIYGIHSMIGTGIVQDGFIYGVDSYGELRCLEAATGKRLWEDLTAVPKAALGDDSHGAPSQPSVDVQRTRRTADYQTLP